jgi:hypothetical protein
MGRNSKSDQINQEKYKPMSEEKKPEPKIQKPILTLDEYLDFCEEYWTIFGPPPEPKKKIEYKLILL